MTTINHNFDSPLEPEDEGSLTGAIGAEKARAAERESLISEMAAEGVDILNASVLNSPPSSVESGDVPRSTASPSGELESEQPGDSGAGGPESYGGLLANTVAGGAEGVLHTWNNAVVPFVDSIAGAGGEFERNASVDVEALQNLEVDGKKVWPEPQDGWEAGAKGISQFLVGFAPTFKMLGAVNWFKNFEKAKKFQDSAAILRSGEKWLRASLRGSLSGVPGDALPFDPWEERLTDIIIDHTDEDRGPVERAVLEYMATDPSDTRGEAMFKRALEGFAVGVGVEGAGRFGVGAVKHSTPVIKNIVDRVKFHRSIEGKLIREGGLDNLEAESLNEVSKRVTHYREVFSTITELVETVKNFNTGNPHIVEARQALKSMMDRARQQGGTLAPRITKNADPIRMPEYPDAPPRNAELPAGEDAATLYKISRGMDAGTIDPRRLRAWQDMGFIEEAEDGALGLTDLGGDELSYWNDAASWYSDVDEFLIPEEALAALSPQARVYAENAIFQAGNYRNNVLVSFDALVGPEVRSGASSLLDELEQIGEGAFANMAKGIRSVLDKNGEVEGFLNSTVTRLEEAEDDWIRAATSDNVRTLPRHLQRELVDGVNPLRDPHTHIHPKTEEARALLRDSLDKDSTTKTGNKLKPGGGLEEARASTRAGIPVSRAGENASEFLFGRGNHLKINEAETNELLEILQADEIDAAALADFYTLHGIPPDLNLERITNGEELELVFGQMMRLGSKPGRVPIARRAFQPKPMESTVEGAQPVVDYLNKLLRNEGRIIGAPAERVKRFLEKWGKPGTAQRSIHEIVEDVQILRQVNANLHATIIMYAKAIKRGRGDSEIKSKVLNLIEVTANWNDLVSGMTTAMGRGLQIFNHTVGPDGNLPRTLGLNQDFVRMTDEEWDKWATGVIAAKDSAKRRKLLMRKPGFQDMIAEWFVNNIISGPITSFINVSAVHLTAVLNPAQELVGSVINKTLWDRSSGEWGADVMESWDTAMDEINGIFSSYSDAFRLNGVAGYVDSMSRRQKFQHWGKTVAGRYGRGLREIGWAGKRFARSATSLDSSHTSAARQIVEESEDLPSWMKSLMTGKNYLDPARGARATELGGSSARPGALRAISSDNLEDRLNTLPGIGKYNPGRIVRHGTVGGKAIDALGVTSNLMARLVSTGDELSKGIFYRANLIKNARRNAREAGLEGTEFSKYVQDATENIPRWAEMDINDPLREAYEQMHRDALEHARTVSFTNPVNSQPSKTIQSAISGAPILKLFVPFIRTPTNLLKYVGERTPGIHAMTKRYRTLSQQLELNPTDVRLKREMERFQAHLTAGQIMWGSVWYMAVNGRITGSGPVNPHERKVLEMTGWQPFSFIFYGEDGKMIPISYRRADPFATFLGFAGTLAENFSDMQDAPGGGEMTMEVAGTIAGAMGIIAKDKSYYQGMSDAMDAFDPRLGSQTKIQRWLAKTASAMVVPNVIASSRQTGINFLGHDFSEGVSAIYEAETVVENILRKAGLTDKLYPGRNMFGEVISRPNTLGWDWLMPFFTNDREVTPLKQLLADSKYGGDFRAMTEQINGDELPIRMKDRMKRLSGSLLKQRLTARLPELEQLGLEIESEDIPGGRLTTIREIVKDTMREARLLIVQGHEISEDGTIYKMKDGGDEENRAAFDEMKLFQQAHFVREAVTARSHVLSTQQTIEPGDTKPKVQILLDDKGALEEEMEQFREKRTQ